MNKRQKIVQQAYLDNEKAVIDQLQKTYKQALKDVNAKNAELMGRMDADTPTVIYQVKYQRQLQKQLSTVLDKMGKGNYSTVSDYLNDCYDDGYLGAMYDLHGQGIPVITPIDQEKVTRAVQIDSKLSTSLYKRLGVDVSGLKKRVASEVSRGIATGQSYQQIAKQIAYAGGISYNNASRIARTEGHRIQTAAQLDACQDAKDVGADVVKQWDATLDSRTRPSHAAADGQIRELDEDFVVGGHHGSAPGNIGVAAEDIHCRCALLQRARWALDDSELETLKTRAEFYGLDKTEDFEDFKEKYLKAVETRESGGIIKASGALNDSNDPWQEKRTAHAKRYYEEIRNSDKQNVVSAISKNSGISSAVVSNAYDHVFLNEYDLAGGKHTFSPDYDMAQSFQRLRDGADIQEHDIIMLHHENLESEYMKQGMTYQEAHELTNKKYNYQATLEKWVKGR